MAVRPCRHTTARRADTRCRQTTGKGAASCCAPDGPHAAADAIVTYIHALKLDATGLLVTYDAKSGSATVFGVAPDQTTREKIVLCCGNVAGVSAVNDMMSVDQSAEEATFYTVVSGDTLSKIAQQHYGSSANWKKIYDTNKSVIGPNANLIKVGQVLTIP